MEEKKELKTVEETFRELDALISCMENKETSLEDAFAAYEKGMKLVKECNESLDAVEKRIQEIHGQTNEIEEF